MKKRKKHTGLIVVTTVLVVGAGALFAGRHAIVDTVKTKTAAEIGKKLLEEQIGKNINIDGQNVDVSEIIDHMDEEDVQKVTDIAGKYISQDNLKTAADMAANGDTEGLKDLAKDQLTEEDKNELQGIYDKYKDQIPGNIQDSIPNP